MGPQETSGAASRHFKEKGWKLSNFALLRYVDLVQSFPLEAPHLIYHGGLKTIMKAFMKTKKLMSSDLDFIALHTQSMSLVKQRSRNYSSITFTTFTKISELQTFLLQVTEIVFVCQKTLPERHFYCLLYFVRGIEMLSSCVVTEEQLEMAQLFLFAFAERYRALLGSEFFTWSFHQFLHLPLCVRRWGTFAGFNSLVTERDIGRFARIVTSGRNPILEIAKRVGKEAQSSSHQWKYQSQRLPSVYSRSEVQQLRTLFKYAASSLAFDDDFDSDSGSDNYSDDGSDDESDDKRSCNDLQRNKSGGSAPPMDIQKQWFVARDTGSRKTGSEPWVGIPVIRTTEDWEAYHSVVELGNFL
eukprot:TRINITY_DN3011_c0_g1_i1.p1 TRINITY_DN3011_c0_g1~~TRINITY_DN3011_c0_g1_i1.p1  ORF type:complete len:357 (-),score=64.58 TRINITY_DN3011_c0_g1_i1:10-1080(-)